MNTQLKEIEGYMQQLVDRQNPPGIAVMVTKDSQVEYHAAYGYTDHSRQVPVTTDTVFHWWSMTKVPTTIAVLQLYDEGLLDLDDPVMQHLPYFEVYFKGERVNNITTRQLLRHNSGLPDTIPAMIGWVHFDDSHRDQTELFKQILPAYNKLAFLPDTRSRYTNLGYLALGAIIEAVSGQHYEDYITDHLLTPLKMGNTGFLYNHERSVQNAAGAHPLLSIYSPLLPFLFDFNKLIAKREKTLLWFNPLYIDTTPSSGLLGSVNDAALLTMALTTKADILSEKSHCLLNPSNGTASPPHLGWPESSTYGRLWVQHRGGGPGFATIMRVYPLEKLSIVIMANGTNLPADRLVDGLAHIQS